MILNKKYKFIFVHIQKNAGSSIKKSLLSFENSEQHKYSHSFIDTEIGNFEDHFKFCFVRNPWDRLVSWYNMMLNKGIHNYFGHKFGN
jgi:chondroitin 4-sulfotransferase 11